MREMNLVRRRSRSGWILVVGVFVAAFMFAFLVAKNNDSNTMAANMAAFDPGYIMSDWQMGNYTSMNESQIQAFLKSKNSCYDTNLSKYTTGNKVGYFSEMSPPRTWHIKDGHFVCMADEVFDGGTAAYIIWQAAQDYHINPQVLLVLLEKEQSLVTDTFPHSQQYRSATGYGCPDTAPCSSQYYGLKNQIRKAAELFRTVLNGGWTNYPLGWNYVQYNPNTGCGGTMVNIRSLATSALYRYTPYQPNAAALGGWNDGCGAYGNMNFYKLFEDWFGGIKYEDEWAKCEPTIFCDMPADEYSVKAIKWMYNSGITQYYSHKGEFAPDVKVSNNQYNSFLSRYQQKFPDSSNNNINEIMKSLGKSGGDMLTRSQAIYYLYLLNDAPVPSSDAIKDLPGDIVGRLAINWVYTNKVAEYYDTPGRFAPYANITRREMAIFLWRLAGEPEVDMQNAETGLVDYPSDNDELGRKAIAWVYGNGITKYYDTPGRFAPYANMTRREMAIFLWRYNGEQVAYNSDLLDLPSDALVSNAINWAYNEGITKYYEQVGEFAPNIQITRREAAIFLYRLYLLRTGSQ